MSLPHRKQSFLPIHPYFETYLEKMQEIVKTEQTQAYPSPHHGTGKLFLIHKQISQGAYVEEIALAFQGESYLGALHVRDGTFFAYNAAGEPSTAIESLPYQKLVFANSGY